MHEIMRITVGIALGGSAVTVVIIWWVIRERHDTDPRLWTLLTTYGVVVAALVSLFPPVSIYLIFRGPRLLRIPLAVFLCACIVAILASSV